MNGTKASAIAEILSSAAILVTLVYLAVEIQQNTATLEATSRQAVLQAASTTLGQVITEPRLWLNVSNPEMTDEEKVQLSAYLIAFMRRFEIDWFQYQSGALDQATWATYQGAILDTLSYSETRKLWEFLDSRSGWDPGFSEHVNELIEDQPMRPRLSYLQAFD